MKTKMIRLLVAAVVFVGVGLFSANAQIEKNTIFNVAVGEMKYTPKQSKESVGSVLGTISKAVILGKITEQQEKFVDAVRASIVKGFSAVRRFNALDGDFKLKELADNENSLYVDGTIAEISTTSKLFVPDDKDLSPYDVHKALISVTINVKNAKDDHLVDSKIFTITEFDCSWVKSSESAVTQALEILSKKITTHYNKLFPLNASIIESEAVKKDKQKELYIDLGQESGATIDMKLTVYSVKIIAGRYAKKELGTIRVTDVMGDDISLCKVVSGGKEIKTALDSGATVVVISNN